MIISLGMDHGGLPLREAIIKYLKQNHHEVIDHGTFTPDSVDYPDFAQLVAEDIAQKKADFGILACTTGIGRCISANKIKGVRAILVQNDDNALFSRLHNNANIICLGGKYQDGSLATHFIDIFLKTGFEGGRHERRVLKMENIC